MRTRNAAIASIAKTRARLCWATGGRAAATFARIRLRRCDRRQRGDGRRRRVSAAKRAQFGVDALSWPLKALRVEHLTIDLSQASACLPRSLCADSVWITRNVEMPRVFITLQIVAQISAPSIYALVPVGVYSCVHARVCGRASRPSRTRVCKRTVCGTHTYPHVPARTRTYPH
eukprot:5309438-Pleurochrysis_carterae.AAC.1